MSLFLFLGVTELNETVVCTNNRMDVLIPKAFFLNKVPPVYVSPHTTAVLNSKS
jgi:hypothetical protein